MHWLLAKSSTRFQVFTDAYRSRTTADRRSTGAYAIYLGSNLISWSSRKQRTIAQSSTESEYKALADGAAELKWLVALLHDLQPDLCLVPIAWCDTQYIATCPIFMRQQNTEK